MYVCVCVCMHACMHACMYVCMYVSMSLLPPLSLSRPVPTSAHRPPPTIGDDNNDPPLSVGNYYNCTYPRPATTAATPATRENPATTAATAATNDVIRENPAILPLQLQLLLLQRLLLRRLLLLLTTYIHTCIHTYGQCPPHLLRGSAEWAVAS